VEPARVGRFVPSRFPLTLNVPWFLASRPGEARFRELGLDGIVDSRCDASSDHRFVPPNRR
jgi:hypothetical protein